MLQRCITCGVFSHRPILFLFPYLTLFLPILGGIQPLIVYYVTESRFLSGRIMFLMKPQHNSRVYHQLVKNIILSKLETPHQDGKLLNTWPNNWLQKFIISIESRFPTSRSMGPFEASAQFTCLSINYWSKILFYLQGKEGSYP